VEVIPEVLAGNIDRTDIISSSSTCDVTSSGSHIGGLIGYAERDCTISNSNYYGNLMGGSCTGGLIGQTFQYCNIYNCYSVGSVTGTSAVGGLIGSADGEVKDCYSTADVTATGYAGGFIGSVNSWSNIFNCYSTGYVDCSGSYTGDLSVKPDTNSSILSTATGIPKLPDISIRTAVKEEQRQR
jgi:hypothetical protein